MWHAACELCRQSQFSPNDVTAFTVRNKQIEFVELHGQEPWSGVRVVCDRCVGELIPILELRVAYQRGRADRLEKACRLIVEAGQSPPDVFGERFNEAYDSAKSALPATDENKGETG